MNISAFEKGLDILIESDPGLANHRAELIFLFKSSMAADEDRKGYLQVQYVGVKEEYPDHLYKTGKWSLDQVKFVAPHQAKKLLRHPDLFIEPEEPADFAVIDDPKLDENLQDAEKTAEAQKRFEQKRDVIRVEVEGLNTAEQLRDYSRERLRGWEPDQRLKDPVKLRESINAQVNILGVQGIS
jgi:hypothetical protein